MAIPVLKQKKGKPRTRVANELVKRAKGDGSGRTIPIRQVCGHIPRRMGARGWPARYEEMKAADGYIYQCVLCGGVIDKDRSDSFRLESWAPKTRRAFAAMAGRVKRALTAPA